MILTAFSPDFQDAYDRRFKENVEGSNIFDEWVKEFDTWINQSARESNNELRREYPPSKEQIKSLAYNFKEEGFDNLYVEMQVRDKRTETGYRTVFRDLETGRFTRNPYKTYDD